MTRIGSLFSGAGALDLAVHETVGGTPAWFVENDPAASKVLAHHWRNVPNHGDVTTVDWMTIEPVDIIIGGFPCQSVSSAGKRAGLRPGTRSGLWSHMRYAISQLHPKLVVIENVRGLLSADAHCDLEPCPWCVGDNEGRPLRACGAVVGDLATLGYVGRIRGLRAADVGAPHGRFRVFITAWPDLAHRDPAGDADRRDRKGWPPAGLKGETGPEAGPVADSDSVRPVRGRGTRGRRDGPQDHREPLAHAHRAGHGRGERRTEPTGIIGGPDAALSGDGTTWGAYGPAIRRWGAAIGRPAPAPTLTGKRGGQQLSPRFVEWLMGWPEGWVTAVPGLSRNDMLRIAGNGCVPQQVVAALECLLQSLPDVWLGEAS